MGEYQIAISKLCLQAFAGFAIVYGSVNFFCQNKPTHFTSGTYFKHFKFFSHAVRIPIPSALGLFNTVCLWWTNMDNLIWQVMRTPCCLPSDTADKAYHIKVALWELQLISGQGILLVSSQHIGYFSRQVVWSLTTWRSPLPTHWRVTSPRSVLSWCSSSWIFLFLLAL